MSERPADDDLIERHPDYVPEPDFFDDDSAPEEQAPDPDPDDEQD